MEPILCMTDYFLMDDLLDFTNEDLDLAGPIGDSCLLSNLDPSLPLSGSSPVQTGSGGLLLSGTKLLGPDEQGADVLAIPPDDLEDMEWLSNFVAESYECHGDSTVSLGDSSSGLQFDELWNKEDHFNSASPVSVLDSSMSSSRSGPQAAVRASRSKRTRTPNRHGTWKSPAPIQATLSLSSPESSPEQECLSTDSNEVLTGEDSLSPSSISEDSFCPEQLVPPPKAVTVTKKPWKSGGKGGKKGQEAAQPWRCLHCATQRTPQWRAGPKGPKTLCNACGVRYKSGRLVPEYRPAGSPGYIGHKHSNSHKKIMEMRKQKESLILQQQQHQQQQPLQSVQISAMLSSNCHQASPLSKHTYEFEKENGTGIF